MSNTRYGMLLLVVRRYVKNENITEGYIGGAQVAKSGVEYPKKKQKSWRAIIDYYSCLISCSQPNCKCNCTMHAHDSTPPWPIRQVLLKYRYALHIIHNTARPYYPFFNVWLMEERERDRIKCGSPKKREKEGGRERERFRGYLSFGTRTGNDRIAYS